MKSFKVVFKRCSNFIINCPLPNPNIRQDSKYKIIGTPLVVQWLRLHLPLQGMWVWSLVRQVSGKGNGNPLQYSCLENPMDGGAWSAAVHGVAKSWTQLSDFTFTFDFHALEKEMATHSSVLAWRIPGTMEPGGLTSMGSHRVGHDWSD